MRLVHHAPQALAVPLAALALIAAGCGDDGGAQSGSEGGPRIGTPLQLASCEDWNNATLEERTGTIADLESFAGGPAGQTPGVGNTLDEDQAYDLFENACDESYAAGFQLYRLYTRAAAFTPRDAG